MPAIHPIFGALITCRNILLNNRINENVLPCLEKILADLDSITISSTRKIVAYCVAEAIAQAKTSSFVSAGRILNLVHNLPLDEGSKLRWDVDYFLSMELLTFLEHFEEIESARSVALFVCKQLACQYSPDAG